MPIVNFTFDRAEAEKQGVNIRESQTDSSTNPTTIYLYDTHIGVCLAERERNMRDDSDFYMVVWNAEKAEPEEICFASTRGWTYPCMASCVDATPEVKAAYAAYQADLAEKSRIAHEIRLAAIPAKGKMVEVVKGRKIAKGTKGLVFWVGPMKSEYGCSPVPSRVGVVVEGQRLFIDGKHVQVIQEGA
jgi:hypothetical protein